MLQIKLNQNKTQTSLSQEYLAHNALEMPHRIAVFVKINVNQFQS